MQLCNVQAPSHWVVSSTEHGLHWNRRHRPLLTYGCIQVLDPNKHWICAIETAFIAQKAGFKFCKCISIATRLFFTEPLVSNYFCIEVDFRQRKTAMILDWNWTSKTLVTWFFAFFVLCSTCGHSFSLLSSWLARVFFNIMQCSAKLQLYLIKTELNKWNDCDLAFLDF